MGYKVAYSRDRLPILEHPYGKEMKIHRLTLTTESDARIFALDTMGARSLDPMIFRGISSCFQLAIPPIGIVHPNIKTTISPLASDITVGGSHVDEIDGHYDLGELPYLTPISVVADDDDQAEGGKATKAVFRVYQPKTNPPLVGVDFTWARHVSLLAPPTPGYVIKDVYSVDEKQGPSHIMVLAWTNFQCTASNYQILFSVNAIHAKDEAADQGIQGWNNAQGRPYQPTRSYLAAGSAEIMDINQYLYLLAYNEQVENGLLVKHRLDGIPEKHWHLYHRQCLAEGIGTLGFGTTPPIGRAAALKKGLLYPLLPGQPLTTERQVIFLSGRELRGTIELMSHHCPHTKVFNSDDNLVMTT